MYSSSAFISYPVYAMELNFKTSARSRLITKGKCFLAYFPATFKLKTDLLDVLSKTKTDLPKVGLSRSKILILIHSCIEQIAPILNKLSFTALEVSTRDGVTVDVYALLC